MHVELSIEPGQSLGLMIRGGVEYNLGIFITGVDKDSVADRAGLMCPLAALVRRTETTTSKELTQPIERSLYQRHSSIVPLLLSGISSSRLHSLVSEVASFIWNILSYYRNNSFAPGTENQLTLHNRTTWFVLKSIETLSLCRKLIASCATFCEGRNGRLLMKAAFVDSVRKTTTDRSVYHSRQGPLHRTKSSLPTF
ncbi:Deafness, autosomal recessive [Homalodisca vitripennis]|nr:Deafness, autosomal recessive [Homalodisca vitripennis]